MGVPRLFPWLTSTFKPAVRHFQQGQFIFHVDNLYIDAPSLLHGASQQVFNYGQAKRLIDPYKTWTMKAKIEQIYKLFFEGVVIIAQTVVPSKTLYIAIDGPAPLAKQAQQRQRRFVAAATRGGSETVFDSNSMTPGTIFMLELTKYVHTAIRKKINSTPGWRNINVVFSSPMVPGEGEHKVLNYIRSLPSHITEKESHCIVGPDGDLIMLALATHLPKIYLFREDQYTPGFHYLLDMGMVRKELPKFLGQSRILERSLDDVADDFILAGFFVGNDFLPKIQMFMFLEDGLELMLATVTTLAKRGIFLTSGGKIYHKGFTAFVEELARQEVVYIADQARIPPTDPRFKNVTLLQNMTTKGLKMGSYRKDYYKKAGIDVEDESQVKRLCMDYLRTNAWVFKYYVHGLPSWRHFYPWHYAPLMGDLLETMENATQKELESIYEFEPDTPSLPFVQLLSVLPPSSAHLLPVPFHKLFLENSVLSKAGFYPKTFEIDYEGKTKEHMGVALLPFVNIEEVIKAYTPIAAKLKNEYVRNSVGRPELFLYDASYTASYTSDYGNIPKMHVKKIVL